MNIPLSNPDITELEINQVIGVLKTPSLSLGPKLPEFENEFARYIGTKFALAVNSGTSALHLVIKAIGCETGDHVITTPFSFIASANCILFERAIPLFVDIEKKTYNIDIQEVEKTLWHANKQGKKIKAILPVHVFGNPCQMDDIKSIAEQQSLSIIEDACEAIGAETGKKKVGSIGDAGVFAFYPNKQITTGEGGMIVTDNEKIAKLCRSLRNQGRGESNIWLAHERLGYNYRLSDINCALGIVQLQRIESILEKRQKIASMYYKKLKDVTPVHLPYTKKVGRQSWFVYVIRLADEYSSEHRDIVLEKLSRKGIGCNKYFPPIHLQPFYRKEFGFKPGDFPVTEHVSERTIALPFYNNLSENEIDIVVGELNEAIADL